MVSTALKSPPISDKSANKNDDKSTAEKVFSTLSKELIIGICSPIGTKKESVIDALKKQLTSIYGYNVKTIRLSEYITKLYNEPKQNTPSHSKSFNDLMHKIKGGDYLRNKYDNAVLAEHAIKEIRTDRNQVQTTKIKSDRNCYIIDSLKNKEELDLFRIIYRDIFYLFSIFSPSKAREEGLIKKQIKRTEAITIIETDEYENKLHGQNVRDTFVEADFFIRVSNQNKSKINTTISRYLNLIFDSDIITPNSHETAMYYAKSAAGNSACLSRQVGAMITDKNGIPIANGWNDVPKAGGNLYREYDKNPQRCKDIGHCSNVTHKNEIVEEIIDQIKDTLGSKTKQDSKKTTHNIETISEIESIIRKSRFKDVIEYSRSIHAEMHAIIIGSQLTGDRMVGGNLYCTTYPCHNCARHIVVAGIKNIYYIEPYKKSLGIHLHNDALTEDEIDESKVRILLYDGVAPRRYLDFFTMNSDNRKGKNGELNNIDFKKVVPKKRLSLQAIPDLENQAIITLEKYQLEEN